MTKLTPEERRELLEFVAETDEGRSWVQRRMAKPAPQWVQDPGGTMQPYVTDPEDKAEAIQPHFGIMSTSAPPHVSIAITGRRTDHVLLDDIPSHRSFVSQIPADPERQAIIEKYQDMLAGFASHQARVIYGYHPGKDMT